MARPFRYTLDRRIINTLIKWLLKLGLQPNAYFLLTVVGRKSGKPHTVPVVIIEAEHKRWLVAPYGVVDWVKNARASGVVTLTRGKHSQNFTFRELPYRQAAPVLKIYIVKYPLTEPYFDSSPNSSLQAFELDARSRPVFELFAT
jgi:deazaflavin-dependent oxidoreductase (nitroreductase family)